MRSAFQHSAPHAASDFCLWRAANLTRRPTIIDGVVQSALAASSAARLTIVAICKFVIVLLPQFHQIMPTATTMVVDGSAPDSMPAQASPVPTLASATNEVSASPVIETSPAAIEPAPVAVETAAENTTQESADAPQDSMSEDEDIYGRVNEMNAREWECVTIKRHRRTSRVYKYLHEVHVDKKKVRFTSIREL